MTARAELKKHLKTITKGRRAFATAIKQTIVLLSDEDIEEEMGDILGDASDGDFDYLTFANDGPEFVAGVEPIAFLGGPGDDPLQQIEGLLIARVKNKKIAELFTVMISGTLAPRTEKKVGKSLAALKLKKPANKPNVDTAWGGGGGDDDD